MRLKVSLSFPISSPGRRKAWGCSSKPLRRNLSITAVSSRKGRVMRVMMSALARSAIARPQPMSHSVSRST